MKRFNLFTAIKHCYSGAIVASLSKKNSTVLCKKHNELKILKEQINIAGDGFKYHKMDKYNINSQKSNKLMLEYRNVNSLL